MQIAHLKLHNIPDETNEALETHNIEELSDNTKLLQIQNELHRLEGELKNVKPNLNIVEVRKQLIYKFSYFKTFFLAIQ